MKKIIYLLCFSTLCGCGTIMNLSSPIESNAPMDMTMNYYGGLKWDIYLSATSGGLYAIPAIIDLPFVLVFDTLTLPVVAIARNIGKAPMLKENETSQKK